MKKERILPLLALLIILAGCVSPAARRADYIQVHPGLDRGMSKAISAGQLVVGMTMDEVRASWGDPDMVTTSVSDDGSDQVWSYDTGHEDRNNDVPVIVRFESGKVTSVVK